MARLRVPPTRSSLLRIQRDLDLVSQGHDLLKQKRDVLLMEVTRLLGDAEALQREVQQRLEKAFAALRRANLTMGTEAVRRTSLTVKKTGTVAIRQRSIMGVVVPTIDYSDEEKLLDYSFFGTSAGLDESRLAFKEALEVIAEMAETVVSVMRLAEEAARAQRRINALENVFIPQYKETIAFILETLEEREREDLYVMKLGKARGERQAGAGGSREEPARGRPAEGVKL
ncbi:MAG: V-type ATP synthase subunit D [Firmicutes bacterium]|nr:V-type ATP synthase subunit D [Bacillota bacterium]